MNNKMKRTQSKIDFHKFKGGNTKEMKKIKITEF